MINMKLLEVVTPLSIYQIRRTMNATNMNYTHVLSKFNIEWDTYEELKKGDYPNVPVIDDEKNNCKVIKWVYIWNECISQTYVSIGTLVYVIRESSAVPIEVDDPLDTNSYHGTGGSLHEELVSILYHSIPIYKHDNTSVHMKIENLARVT